ncbi:hypothetical protein G9P44_000423 [Scheffersomyces stipitis]|nr:hypothetical protein G9P44_000423 [Scheffersomyces stipitis]
MDNLESIRSIVEEFKIPDKCLRLYDVDPSTLSEYVQVALVPNSKRYTQMPVIIAANHEFHYEDEDHPMIQHTSEQTILSEKQYEDESPDVADVSDTMNYNPSDNDYNNVNNVKCEVDEIGTSNVNINSVNDIGNANSNTRDSHFDTNINTVVNDNDNYNISEDHNDNFDDIDVYDLHVNDTISSIADSPVNTQFSLPLPAIHDKSLYETTSRNKNTQTSDDIISINGDNFFDNTLPSEPFYGLHDYDK